MHELITKKAYNLIKGKKFALALKEYEKLSLIFGWNIFNVNVELCKKNIYANYYVKKIKVSVIIAVYNCEMFLAECVDSLLNQTFKDVEFIFVDDGSTDSSLHFLKEVEKSDGRVKVIHQRKKSAGAARNLGFKYSRGEYVIFLDSDDIFEKELLEKAYNKAKATDADIVIFEAQEFDSTTKETRHAKFPLSHKFFPQKEIFDYTDFHGKIYQANSSIAWNKLIKKHFIDSYNIKFQDIKSSNDTVFTYLCLVLAKKMVFLPEILVNYRTGNKNSLQRSKHLSWECVLLAFMNLKENLILLNLYNSVKQSFVNKALCSALYYCETVDHRTKLIMESSLAHTYFRKLDILPNKENYFFYKKNYIELENIIKKHYIPIVYACDKHYFNIMLVSLKSVIESTKQNYVLLFYIMHDNSITDIQKNMLLKLESDNIAIKFINMQDKFSNLNTNVKHITTPSFYRLEIAKTLSYHKKVIYLDCDTIVISDIKNFYDINIDNYYCAGVKALAYDNKHHRKRLGIDTSTYVNSGVLLFNIEKLNNDEIYKKFIKLSINDYASGDQDIINIACHNKILILNREYNFMTKYLHISKYSLNSRDIKIVHYADKVKPWNDKNSPYADYFWNIAKLTPVYDYLLSRVKLQDN